MLTGLRIHFPLIAIVDRVGANGAECARRNMMREGVSICKSKGNWRAGEFAKGRDGARLARQEGGVCGFADKGPALKRIVKDGAFFGALKRSSPA